MNEKKTTEICKNMPNFSSHKLIKNIVQGFDENGVYCHLINVEDLPSYPRCSELFHRGCSFEHSSCLLEKDIDLSYIDLPLIKYFMQTYKIERKASAFIDHCPEEKICLLTYGRSLPHLLAMSILKKKYPQIVTCSILGDLAGQYAGDVTNGTKKSQTMRQKLAAKLMDYQMKKVVTLDCFVLLTKYMAEALHLQKPFCIVEGVGKKCEFNPPVDDGDKRIITYAGALEFQYNMRGVIEAFKSIENPNYELWLFGDGSAKSYLENAAKDDERIKVFGIVPPDKIAEAYQKSTVLLNPRQNTALYTKYTFPSKTMESLLSGRPYVGYKLDGIPDEYDPYIFYVQDNSVDSLRERLISVCEMTLDTRRKHARKTWKFMMKNKTAKVQGGKILALLAKLNDDG